MSHPCDAAIPYFQPTNGEIIVIKSVGINWSKNSNIAPDVQYIGVFVVCGHGAKKSGRFCVLLNCVKS